MRVPPMLTVAIATHDREKTLKRCLLALSAAQAPPGGWKLIVADDGSTDGTRAVVSEFAGLMPLEYAHGGCCGKSATLNSIVPRLDGDVVVLCDDDILVPPGWLIEHRRLADDTPDYDVFGGRLLPEWEQRPPPWLLRAVPPNTAFAITADDAVEGPCEPWAIWGGNMSVRRSVFREGFRYDPDLGPSARTGDRAMGEDYDFVQRLAAAGHRCWFSRKVAARHVIRAEQLKAPWLHARAESYGRGLGRAYSDGGAARALAAGAREAAKLLVSGCRRLAPGPESRLRAGWDFHQSRGILRQLAAELAGRASRPAEPIVPPRCDDGVGLSVVIASFHRAAGLDRLLTLLRPQVEGRARRRVIVVSDASHDRACAQVLGRHRRFVDSVAAPKNGGLAAARNLGGARADQDFLVFIDDDCEPPPYWLDWLASVIAENPDADAVGGATRPLLSPRPGVFERFLAECGFHPNPVAHDRRLTLMVTANLAVRRALFLAVGGFDETMRTAEDRNLTYRLSRRAAVLHLDPAWFVYYSMTSSPWAHFRHYYHYGRGLSRALALEADPPDRALWPPEERPPGYWRSRAAQRLRNERSRPEYGERPLLERYLFAALAALTHLALDMGFARAGKRPDAGSSAPSPTERMLAKLKKFVKMGVSCCRHAKRALLLGKEPELIIIVPYRQRAEDLKQFVPHMHRFLRDIKHRIVVIEQAGSGLFNRAKLLNVGFKLYQDQKAYFCFHDVDMLPESAACDYSYPVMPTHLAAYCSQFDYQMLPSYFGGVLLVNKEDFQRINGCSNQYWGWGGEDDDLRKRFDQTWTIPRRRRMGRYHCIERLACDHPMAHEEAKRQGNPQYGTNRTRLGSGEVLPYDSGDDGLSGLRYEHVETIIEDGYVRHVVLI